MKQPLYKHLCRLRKKRLYIKELKDIYTPVELSSQLLSLVEQEMIHINWQTKTISIQFNLENALINRYEITKYERNIPQYMKTEQLEINKPYFKK